MVTLSAKPIAQGKRLRIPTTFLSSGETAQQLVRDLQSIRTEGYARCFDGLECIKSDAFEYEKKTQATSLNEPQGLLLTASANHVFEEAWTLAGRNLLCGGGGGGGGGVARARPEGGGGGLAKWASVPGRFVMWFWQFWCKFCGHKECRGLA